MKHNYKALGVAAAIALSPMAASAATVDITFQNFGAGNPPPAANITTAKAALATFMGSTTIAGGEDFEGFTNCPAAVCASADDTTPIVSSNVGDFYRIGGATGSGQSQVVPTDDIVVRQNNPTNTFSRYDVVGGHNWLDSNDHEGIRWEIPGAASGLSEILKIAFFLTDVDDVGNIAFEINTVGGDVVSQNIFGAVQGNDGGLDLVTMSFSTPVDIATIRMTSGTNDGFGIDGIQVGVVPLPAAGWLMIAGLGGLAALRRRKRAA
jgi:hypothetical protein